MKKLFATVLQIKTKEKTRNWIRKNLLDPKGNPEYEPYLISTNYFSFFKCLLADIAHATPKVAGYSASISPKSQNEVRHNIEATRNRLNSNINFLQNSSIWIRFCDNGDWDGSNESSQTDDIKSAIEELNWFQELRLYEFKAAKEYIEYQLRAQSQNFLTEMGGHGVHITPMIYSDEAEFRDFFFSKESRLSFKFLGEKKDSIGFHTKDVSLRILLVDDKIGTCGDTKQSERIHESGNCDNCSGAVDCKLRVIKSLLSGDFIKNTDKQKGFKEKTYWAENVISYVLDHIGVSDVWSINEKQRKLLPKKNGIKSDLEKILKNGSAGVQIIGVRDLESALSLLSCCKFDIVLLDYLLGERGGGDTERSYSTEIFEFLGHDFDKRNERSEIVNMLRKSLKCSCASVYPTLDDSQIDSLLKEFQDNVKLNRGPLDKFWIIPMTSYNSSFISDLQSKHVRLIDHRWNISQGADPINTPWKFLYKLNEFVDLQLRLSVYWKDQLLTFIQYTGEDLEARIKNRGKEKEEGSCFEEFKQFMGAEYANLMKRYGSQYLIERDARGSSMEQSPFAKYISDSFYNDYKDYGVVTELNRLMKEFYSQAASMFDDRFGRQRLREAFERLRVFISYNRLINDFGVEKKEDITDKKVLLSSSLRLLNVVVDSEFNLDMIWKELDSQKA